MEVLGHYSNGAQKIKVDHRTYVGFPDCSACDGDGYVLVEERSYYGYGMQEVKKQCPVCAINHGMKDAIRTRAEQLQKELKRDLRWDEISIRANGHLTTDQFRSAEDININHPLANEYRLCLRMMWAEPPKFYDAEGNLQEEEDRYSVNQPVLGDWVFHPSPLQRQT